MFVNFVWTLDGFQSQCWTCWCVQARENGCIRESLQLWYKSKYRDFDRVYLHRMFLKLLCRQVLMFSYLLSLNCLDFCRFVSWQTVSSSTNIFDSSHITMSGRVLDWNATSIDSNSADGRSTSRRWSALLCVHIQFAIMSRILLCRSKYRLRAAEQFDKTCLFVIIIIIIIINFFRVRLVLVSNLQTPTAHLTTSVR